VTRHAYGPLPDQHATLRGAGPTVVVLHGGFWRARYRAPLMDPLCDALAALGFASWNVEYRRVGAGGGYPETLEDVAAACRAAPDPVLALGHSAGGHLALWAAAEGLVPAAVSLAGVCDLAGAARAGVRCSGCRSRPRSRSSTAPTTALSRSGSRGRSPRRPGAVSSSSRRPGTWR